MSILLYPHNQTAYKMAISMMQESGKAAVIHPTGTGKSFIAFKLAEEQPEADIVWLAPSEYIFRSQRENYLEAGGDEAALSRIHFFTYAKLMYSMEGIAEEGSPAQGGACLVKEAPDYIILDEFHRCGAEGWGKGVEMLLGAFPDARVLGLSATHIRYLDSRRDMAQELFDGCIASRMELGEAMRSGILPAPLYICGIYEYRDELRKITQRVNSQRNVEVRDKSAKLLEKLRHCLQSADGPREIFGRYMKKNGKYIVFCSGREHMEKMIGLAGQWFGLLDKAPTIYRAIYDNNDSPEEVKRFRTDNSEHLKLLFCIDMLNEGVHVADVDGAVLLRPTASPTLYLQQVGRALAVPDQDGECQPVIFDLVDNFDSLRCIDSFLEEYHRIPDADEEKKKDRPSYDFRLVDETRDSRRIFEQLCRCLASSWEECFHEAEKYFAEHGNIKVPKRYITEEGIALGSWLMTQRRVRAGAVPGKLSEEQIERLNQLGMVWESNIGKAWETGYRELVKFYGEKGHVDVPARYFTEGGYPLGRYVTNQRTAWKNGREATEIAESTRDASIERQSERDAGGGVRQKGRVLTAEQERKLDALGFIWEKSEQLWERYYTAAKEFYEREGHLEVPVKYTTADGLRLGAWIQGKSTGRDSLPQAKVEALEAIGMVWGSRYDSKWDEKFRLAERFYQEHGHLEVPRDYVVEGVRLGRWINALRSARENPGSSHYRLDEEHIRQLDSIGMRWAGESWEARYRLAEQYYQAHGNLKVSQAYAVVADGSTGERIWLGKWLVDQRRKRNNPGCKHALTQEQEKRLEAIGMEW